MDIHWEAYDVALVAYRPLDGQNDSFPHGNLDSCSCLARPLVFHSHHGNQLGVGAYFLHEDLKCSGVGNCLTVLPCVYVLRDCTWDFEGSSRFFFFRVFVGFTKSLLDPIFDAPIFFVAEATICLEGLLFKFLFSKVDLSLLSFPIVGTEPIRVFDGGNSEAFKSRDLVGLIGRDGGTNSFDMLLSTLSFVLVLRNVIRLSLGGKVDSVRPASGPPINGNCNDDGVGLLGGPC